MRIIINCLKKLIQSQLEIICCCRGVISDVLWEGVKKFNPKASDRLALDLKQVV
jgi:hypothetical protein